MKGQNSIRIYSFYYKPTVVPVDDNLYKPIMVGNALMPAQVEMTGDDAGMSISEKNRYYSELTGIYWVWKNTRQDITGACHYRRYFHESDTEPFDLRIKRFLYWPVGLWQKRYGLIYTSNIRRFRNRILDEDQILKILQDYDGILPQKRKLRYTVEEHYRRYHNSTDLGIISQVLCKKYPAWTDAYNKMLNGYELYANNMFILPSHHYNRFMEWWFAVLFDIENALTLENYTGYQERVMGFIAERMLTTWFLHENLKVRELPVVYFKKIKFVD